jgi:ATP-dependent helicase/nuclease subunit B
MIAQASFPSRISASDIEMLIRNPYGFYAKKILKLKKLDDIAQKPKLSEFGNFMHKIFDEYTKSYNKLITTSHHYSSCSSWHSKQLTHLLEMSADMLRLLNLPSITKKIWQIKLTAIAEEFIDFDEKRRSNIKQVYSEIFGEMIIDAAGHKIKIVAIADRIEISHASSAMILDYKTGILPTEKDVHYGLSPQLIIESLIAIYGGFGIKINDVTNIIYIKVASSKPYIQTKEIEITNKELKSHETFLQTMLERFIVTASFPSIGNKLQYDDYKHLARNF